MKTIAFIGLSAFAMAASAEAPSDQVKASFDRLLNPAPVVAKVTPPAVPNMGEDPLRTAVAAVLWQEPSGFHSPLVAQAPGQRTRQ